MFLFWLNQWFSLISSAIYNAAFKILFSLSYCE